VRDRFFAKASHASSVSACATRVISMAWDQLISPWLRASVVRGRRRRQRAIRRQADPVFPGELLLLRVPPVSPMPAKVLDDACRGLRGLGYDLRDARERVLNAWRELQVRGKRFGMSALIGLAVGFRASLEGESPA
jgi:hypothetical protein